MRMKLAMLAIVVGIGSTVLGTATADGYVHRWDCTVGSASVCWDSSGQPYNPWWEVSAYSGRTHPEVCAKAQATNSATKNGSGCGINTTSRHSCFGSTTPESQAYMYWGGGGSADGMQGDARTYDNRIFC